MNTYECIILCVIYSIFVTDGTEHKTQQNAL